MGLFINDDVENTIAIESSTWNNLGDAFYQNSIINIFKIIFPNKNIVSFDGPPRRAFRPRKRKGNVFDARFITDASHYVFSGPIMGSKFMDEYAPLIKKLVKRGRTYSLLSIHVADEESQLERILDFLKSYPPTAIHTRDQPSFKKIKGIAKVEMDGICFAWFVSKMPALPNLSISSPYVCISYYRNFEPAFENVSEKCTDLVESGLKRIWPRLRDFYEKYWRYLRFLDYRNPVPNKLGAWQIVRPVQGFAFHPDLIYSRKNSYITYNPNNFLAIYKYCQGVITDRVHSGVAGLSFGKPVMVEKVDSRFALFDKLPIKHKNGFMTLEPKQLEPFYEELVEWLLNDFATASRL